MAPVPGDSSKTPAWHIDAARGPSTPVAVGTRISSRAPRADPYTQLSRIRLVWGFLCQGCITAFLTRAASILSSRPHIAVAVAHSDGQGRRFFSAAEGLVRDDPRGACHWPRAIAREPRLYSVEPI